MRHIPVLLYHSISEPSPTGDGAFSVHPDDFSRHMDEVHRRGLRTLTVSQLVDELREGRFDITVPSALVTFDDGYADFASAALPAMQEREIASTLYVTSGWLEGGSTPPTTRRPAMPFLQWDQLRALRDADVELGAHSHTHLQMDTLRRGHALDELLRSKSMLEDAIDEPVRSFAYPHGYSSPWLRRAVEEAGFDSAAAVRNALSHPDDDLFMLARLTVMHDTPAEVVGGWLDGVGADLAPRGERLLTIGWRTYRRARAIISRRPGTSFA